MSSNASVVIFVTDINDNLPEFSSLLFSVDLPEDTVVDTVITAVTASDKDKGSNAEVTYGLVNPLIFQTFVLIPRKVTSSWLSKLTLKQKQCTILQFKLVMVDFQLGHQLLTF